MRQAYLIGSLILLTVPAGAASEDRPFIDAHVRCLDRLATQLVAEATGLSPTVRRLIAEIERSDVIVYVRLDQAVDRYTADTRLLTSVPGARYALIELSPLSPKGDLIPLLGHELWHAVEIARAKDVHNADDMRRLFRQIGWASATKDRFETPAALLAGRQVRHEVAAAGKPGGSLVGG